MARLASPGAASSRGSPQKRVGSGSLRRRKTPTLAGHLPPSEPNLSALPTSSTQIFFVRSCSQIQARPLIRARVHSPSQRSSFPDLAPRQRRGTQHLVRLRLRRGGVRARERSRPRNSVVPSYRPLQWGDVAEARPLSPGSGEGPRQAGTRNRRGEERVGVPSTARAAGPVVPDHASRCHARMGAIVDELGPDGST